VALNANTRAEEHPLNRSFAVREGAVIWEGPSDQIPKLPPGSRLVHGKLPPVQYEGYSPKSELLLELEAQRVRDFGRAQGILLDCLVKVNNERLSSPSGSLAFLILSNAMAHLWRGSWGDNTRTFPSAVVAWENSLEEGVKPRFEGNLPGGSGLFIQIWCRVYSYSDGYYLMLPDGVVNRYTSKAAVEKAVREWSKKNSDKGKINVCTIEWR
jgi:hypothetical protein